MRGLCPLLFLLFAVVILALYFAPAPSARSSSAPFRIIFVKTHKTASSTLAAIVRRVGKAHGMHFLDPPDHINVDSFRGVLQTPYDIVCNHARDSPWLECALAHFRFPFTLSLPEASGSCARRDP